MRYLIGDAGVDAVACEDRQIHGPAEAVAGMITFWNTDKAASAADLRRRDGEIVKRGSVIDTASVDTPQATWLERGPQWLSICDFGSIAWVPGGDV